MHKFKQCWKDTFESNAFTSSIKVIPFSKYLRLHLIVVLSHAKWINLIFILPTFHSIHAIFKQRHLLPTQPRLPGIDHSRCAALGSHSLERVSVSTTVQNFVLRFPCKRMVTPALPAIKKPAPAVSKFNSSFEHSFWRRKVRVHSYCNTGANQYCKSVMREPVESISHSFF